MNISVKLSKGDTIAVFSPSSPATATNSKRYLRAKKFLQDKGFNILEGNLTGKKDYYRSGTIKDRAQELNDLIYNKDVKCIISSIGGMNSNSILPYIDYEAFKKNPKIVIGYSDVTAILLALYAKTGISTYYGPAMVASFGEFEPFVSRTFEYFEDILMNNYKLPYTLKTPEFWTDEFINWGTQDRSKVENKNRLITVNKGETIGRFIGGNLNTMEGIWGTEYMPKIEQGDILFIEDSLKDISTIERSFSLLKLSGVFDKISGIVLGKHELFDDLKTNRKPYEVLLEVMGDRDIPILAEFDCCHTHPMLTIPIGSIVKLDATNKKLSIINN